MKLSKTESKLVIFANLTSSPLVESTILVATSHLAPIQIETRNTGVVKC